MTYKPVCFTLTLSRNGYEHYTKATLETEKCNLRIVEIEMYICCGCALRFYIVIPWSAWIHHIAFNKGKYLFYYLCQKTDVSFWWQEYHKEIIYEDRQATGYMKHTWTWNKMLNLSYLSGYSDTQTTILIRQLYFKWINISY